MGPVIAEITIDAPRERVFEFVSDLAARPSFCDHFQSSYRLQRIGSTGIGAAARFHVDARFTAFWMETVIAENEAPHLLIEEGRGGRIDRVPMGTAWELVDAGGGMTDVRVSFWTDPERFFDRLKDRFASAAWHRRQWKRALVRLRDVIETDAAIERVQVAGASRL